MAVDDDPVNLKILTSVLSIKDYAMVTVTSGIDALIKLDTDHWDLIITDVMMPQMSGYELTMNGFVWKQRIYKRKYNHISYTLNSISALASFDTKRMSHLIDAFSSYLRLSFNFLNAEPMIPIEHELELVRAYLYIEKERFEDRMTINWDLPENLHFQLPPLTQPLVENAVRHGILSRSKGGTLTISIKELANDIEITIADNGKGMTAEQLQQLLSSQSNVTQGIGFLNTHKRLLRVYATGLQIKSKEGQGTSVSFIIPSEKEI